MAAVMQHLLCSIEQLSVVPIEPEDTSEVNIVLQNKVHGNLTGIKIWRAT